MNRILKPRIYTFPSGGQRLILMPPVLEIFCQYRQRLLEPEAGGLLLAEFDLPNILIAQATPPGERDKRSRVSFVPDRNAQRLAIQARFKDNRHFVGEWHTHPEPFPTPSLLDLDSVSDAFQKSKHELESFIMIIVGNQAESLNLWVSSHTGTGTCQLAELLAENYPLSTNRATSNAGQDI